MINMSLVATLFYHLYGKSGQSARTFIRKLVTRLERGEIHSRTLRRIFCDYHQVVIGLYTHGGCFVPGAIDNHTIIGRYCSIAHGVRTMNRNHPMEFKSTHAFFFNPELGRCREDRIAFTPLEVGNDVWIGAQAIIMPHVRQIGHGAVVAAGAVVNKDVPPYAVVVGNPARVVRFRFPKPVIEQLLASHWWEKPIDQLDIEEFSRPFVAETAQGDPGNVSGV
jgi:acetyltransferase-like isoleucine patch superfamily enzyme